MTETKLTVRARFDAAHRMHNAPIGEHTRVHGHHYEVEVDLAVFRRTRMVLELTDARRIVRTVAHRYDHRWLRSRHDDIDMPGEVVLDEVPTMEVLAWRIADEVAGEFTAEARVVAVRVSSTRDAVVEVKPCE